MAALAAAHGVALRPHAKTHKSVDIARRQIAAGARGICCAKIGEAEVMADGGVAGILITSPVAAPRAIERLAALAVRTEGLMEAIGRASCRVSVCQYVLFSVVAGQFTK